VGSATLSDTVGFIRDLPHKLVEAFQATLQEAADADLLLHVVDAASPTLAEQMIEVERVLEEIGAAEVPQLLVFNKADQLAAPPREASDWIEGPLGVRRRRVFVSALTGAGIDTLRQALAEHVSGRAAEAIEGPMTERPPVEPSAQAALEPGRLLARSTAPRSSRATPELPRESAPGAAAMPPAR
jgi:GTP-binding protein HflX